MQNDIETLLGGKEVPVVFLDGKTETVKVRTLPMREMPNYLQAYENEPACVDLFCGKPQGWSEKLSRESFEEVMKEGERLNLDFLTRYAERVVARRKKVRPEVDREIVTTIVKQILPQVAGQLGSLSPTSSLRPGGPLKKR